MSTAKTFRVLPGFGPTLGYTLAYLSLLVLIPLAAVFLKTAELTFAEFWNVVTAPRVVASYKLSFGMSGWIGQFLEPLGIQVAFKPLGVLVALVFIGLPFVVRTVQPILEDLDTELEEAATSLGAQRWQAFRHVILPIVFPALLTGFALAFARAVGEYGSVIFIAGNLPMVSEITPLMIITKLEQYDYTGATAIATVMLILSFALLLLINGLQAWTAKRTGRDR